MIAVLPANTALVAMQAALVALPGCGAPATVRRLRGGTWVPLAVVAVLAVVAFVVAGELGPSVATALSRLALVAVPPLAALALGWAAHGARRWAAALALPLFALAWARTGHVDGDAAAALLSALSCVTLARMLAAAVPGACLKAGLVAWAVYDAISVFGHPLVSPDATVDAAVPAPGFPQLQVLDLHAASLGYADVFVAAVLGGVLAAEGRRQWPVALLLLGLSAVFDLLFLAFSTLPATVPVAAALLIRESAALRGGIRRDRRSWNPGAAAEDGVGP
jgi:hypothetical protein